MEPTGTDAYPVRASLGDLRRPLADTLTRLQRDDAARKLWQHDSSFWTSDPAHRKVVENRLGWLHVLDTIAPHLDRLEACARKAREDGLSQALLLGMGGSSLCPEVFRFTFGVAPGALELSVLDNTAPEAVLAAEAGLDLEHTLFLVSSKSGGTVESSSFYHYFRARLEARGVSHPGAHFIAITDPDTVLATLAHEDGFRDTWINPPDIGGRYSALSFFGMVPAALLGMDLRALWARAREMLEACGPDSPPASNPGVWLGAVLGSAARYGFDKLTLMASPSLAPLGAWLEQLVAESTGKSGRGVVPVDLEPPGEVADYSPDRLIVAFALKGESQELEARAEALAAAGHPVVYWEVPDRAALAAEFLRWEVATAICGALIEVDPFDEPNVTESKDTTRALLGAYERTGHFPDLVTLAEFPGLRLEADTLSARRLRSLLVTRGYDPASLDSWLAGHFGSALEGDYIALCAYLRSTPARMTALEGLRRRIGVGRATTLGIGPRFLHSTGQLHKGGANTGVFLQILAPEDKELEIPGSRFGFLALRDAQALGDLQVLDRRERRALRVRLLDGPDAGLAALDGALARALALTGPLRAHTRRSMP